MNYLKELTTHIDIKGYEVPNHESSVSHKFIIQLETKCPDLIHLGLCKQIFDANEVSKIILRLNSVILCIYNVFIPSVLRKVTIGV